MVFCSIGEIYNELKKICEKCPFGKYNLEINATQCYDCLHNAICLGGSEIVVRPGFWRSNYLSKNVYQCDKSLENCKGGVGPECSANYQGRLCEECRPDENKQPTTKNVFGECFRCDFSQSNIWINIFFVLFSLISYAMLLIVFVRENVDLEYKSLFRIIINYFEDVYFYPIRNNPLSEKSELFNFINRQIFGFSGRIFSFDCFYVNFGFDGSANSTFPSAFNRLAFFILLFFCFLFLNSFVWIFLYRKKSLLVLKNELILNLLLLIYLFYPALSLQSIQPFKCINIDGFDYIQSNLSNQCWIFNHYLGIMILCVPNLFLWTIFLPIKMILPKFGKNSFYLLQTFSKRNVSNKTFRINRSTINLENFGQTTTTKESNVFFPISNIFYVGYKDEFHDWEKYELGKKLLLVYFSGLFENEPRRIFFCLQIYLLYFLLLIRKKPHKINYMNTLETFHCLLFIFSYFILIIANTMPSFNNMKPIVVLFAIFHILFLFLTFQKLILKTFQKNALSRKLKNFSWKFFIKSINKKQKIIFRNQPSRKI